MQAFTLSTRQTKAGRALESFFGAVAVRFGQRLVETFRPDLLPGETMPDLTLVLQLFGRRLRRLRRRVEAADVRLGQAVLVEKQALAARDGVLARLRGAYVQVRELVGSLFGRAGLLATALDGKPARRGDELLRQSEEAVAAVAAPGFVEPEPLHGSAMGFRPAGIRQQLGPLVAAADKSLWHVETARRKVQTARYQRTQAMKELGVFYLWSGRVVQAICHVLGETWLAERTHKPMRELDRKARPTKKAKAAATAKADDGKLPAPVLTAEEDGARGSSPVLAPEEGGAGRSKDVLAAKEPDSGSPNRLQRTKRRDLAAANVPGEVHRRLAAPAKSQRRSGGSGAALPGARRRPDGRRSTLTEGVRSPGPEGSPAPEGANRAKVRGKSRNSGIRARVRRLFSRE